MAYGLAALSGLLSGLQGLPEGMITATKLGQNQQQIDEQRRQFEESRLTDLSALAPILGPLGVNLGAASGKVPTGLVPTIVGAQATQAEKTRKAEERGRLVQAARGTPLEPYSALLGIEGGPALAQALAGQQKPIATEHPIYDPKTGQWIQPPTIPSVPFEPPPGSRAVPTIGPRGEMKSTRYEPPSENQMRAVAALKDAGWTEDMPGYAQALYQLTTPLTPVTEGGFAVPRTMTVPPPPAKTGGLVPSGPGQQPSVQAAGKELSAALGNMATITQGLPGVPPVSPAPGPQRMPGGGIQGPPKTQAMGQEQVQKLADMRTFLSALNTAEQLYEPGFTGSIQGRLGAGRQFSGIRSTPKETQFRTVLQSFANQLLYLRSGAAVTPQEYERILGELPTANDPDDVFKTKLTTARGLLQEAIKNREAEFARYGFRGAQPGGGPASATPEIPSGGPIRWGRDAQGRPIPLP